MAKPVIGWEASRDEWLAGRRAGIGGSDISAVLGFSAYRSSWDVWAEKTNTKHWDDGNSDAAELGVALEPWLREQAGLMLDAPVRETECRTYAHDEHPWRMCSPDGILQDGRLLEAKTAGLASGFGTPRGWEGGELPLGYELQVRWSMHVMDAPAAEVIALIAGLGLQRRTVTRDAAIEADLVAQVTAWWDRHVTGGVEPPLGARDAELMQLLYPRSDGTSVDLSHTDVLEHWSAYQAAHDREKAAKADKATAAANVKRLLGEAERGMVDDRCIASWSQRRGAVKWRPLLEHFVNELIADRDFPVIDVDHFIESRAEAFRKPSTRSLDIKDMT